MFDLMNDDLYMTLYYGFWKYRSYILIGALFLYALKYLSKAIVYYTENRRVQDFFVIFTVLVLRPLQRAAITLVLFVLVTMALFGQLIFKTYIQTAITTSAFTTCCLCSIAFLLLGNWFLQMKGNATSEE